MIEIYKDVSKQLSGWVKVEEVWEFDLEAGETKVIEVLAEAKEFMTMTVIKWCRPRKLLDVDPLEGLTRFLHYGLVTMLPKLEKIQLLKSGMVSHVISV